ncbi:phosphate/phosphite/phosphonate ABC transporter substrate-binding protein [Lutibaculum baratangense]|uniref:phosphate/phosphite/phosphonate ABC transporter substrate-binding protein n=1 Tax=Lutibaculum baratangense TaxID=1358440 RepID=UPI00058EF2FB|nr:phosphate/phosphite/phosphonate ABC transporter substrate-binding protein [Lutibaculum baratangense]
MPSLNLAFRRLVASCLVAGGLLSLGAPGASAETLRFAVGPFQATPSDTKTAYEPFFAYIAQQLDADYELAVTNDWAGIAVALANGQADVAWMGPWGYVLAHNEGGAEAVATVKYDGEPTYHAIILARPDVPIESWPEDAEGLSISFADVGSTSGWLIPHFWFHERSIDPRSYFGYRDGASHAANVMAVANGQVDLATDYDRNLAAMIERGIVDRDDLRIVWRSDPLPNDPLVVREGLDPEIVSRLQEIVVGIGEEQAQEIMPPHYTGWVPADHESYAMIENAGRALGKLKQR